MRAFTGFIFHEREKRREKKRGRERKGEKRQKEREGKRPFGTDSIIYISVT